MNNIEQLQKLLIEEIIEKGYSQEEFEQFVQTHAPGKDDLSEWQFEDLKSFIINFQQQKQSGNNTTPQNFDISGFQLIDEQQYQMIVSNQHKIYIDNIALDPYEKIIQCQLEKYHIEPGVEMQFSISHPFEIRDQGLWSFLTKKSIIVFQVQTFPMQWKVQRTLQDFADFRKIICHYFPEKIIPQFPYQDLYKLEDMLPKIEDIIISIKNLLSIFNKKSIVRTMQPSLWMLNEVDLQQFHKKFQEEIVKGKRYSLQQRQTKTGELKIELSFEGYKKYLNQSSYPRNGIHLLTQTIYNLKEYIACQKKSEEYLFTASSCLTELSSILGDQIENHSKSEISKYLTLVNDHFNQLIFEIDDTCQLLDNHLTTIFSKILGSHRSYIRLLENVNQMKSKFVNDYNALNKKKEELIKFGDPKQLVQKVAQQHKLSEAETEKLQKDNELLKNYIYQSDSLQVNQLQHQFVYMIQSFSKAMDEQFKHDQQKLIAELGGFLYAKEKLCQKYTEQWKELLIKYENSKKSQN